jgi:arabinan endo-1,5-alpha-L-arabinosidase
VFIRKCLASLAALACAATPLTAAADSGPTTTNPVASSFADTYADPSVIQGRDGWWYAYATSDPLVSGGPFGLMHIAKTKDFGSWTYVGTVFTEETKPVWADTGSFFWAPDIRYVDGRYVMYFTVTNTKANSDPWDFAIGAATAPTPAGPWTATDGPVVAPRPSGDGRFFNTIDPALLTTPDGKRYLYFGGFFGGIWVTELSADGLHAVGSPTQVTIGDRYEGAYVVRKNGWYYLIGSSSNCCAGPTTGYTVFAGRSKSPLGPFLDADGRSMLASRVGGTAVVTQNGNRWIGPGHHALMTDADGQDHIVYHAIDRNVPWLSDVFGVNRRPTLIDRLDWIDGWPRTRAGAGPSEGPQPAPVTGSGLGIDSTSPATGLVGATAVDTDELGGPAARIDRYAATKREAASSVRLTTDVRLDGAGLTTVLGEGKAVVSVDGSQLIVAVGNQRATAPVPATVNAANWHRLEIQADRNGVSARLSDAGLGEALADVAVGGVDLPEARVALASTGPVLVDNLTVRPAATKVTKMVPVPEPGRALASYEFDNGFGPGWSWLREDPATTVADGKVRWPVGTSDLVGRANTSPLLLHDAPAGDSWMVETKLHLELGENDIRNYQQAGLIVYRGDDDFARLGHVAIWGTRQTEFGRELVARPSDGATIFGGAAIGTPGDDTWMRIAYHRNAAGEHVYRAGTSNDGKKWTWGASWVLPAGPAPKVGLYAHGDQTPSAAPDAVAYFDYVRFTR